MVSLLNAAAQQWAPINSPTSLPLYCVEFLNEDTGFVGGVQNSGLFKTTDGGNTWTLYQHIGVDSFLLSGNNINDIQFLDDNTGFAVGWNVWNNCELILKTTDGGLIWNISYLGVFGGSLFSDLLESVHFVNSTTGYCAGKNGRILKTMNAGGTWSALNAGTSEDLYAVYFSSGNDGHAVGFETILNTSNGGSVWTKDSSQIYPKSTHFLNDSLGYISGEAGLLMKTTDGGLNWVTKSTYTSNDMMRVLYTNTDTAYVAAENYIYVTVDGGNLWERQMASFTQAYFWDIMFIDSATGYCVSDEGDLLKTTNGGGATGPTSNFIISSWPYCKDSIISFTNNGPIGYTYEWLINGVTYATTLHASGTFPADSTYTISLIAYNGTYYDTSVQTITMSPSLDFMYNLNAYAFDDTICFMWSTQIRLDSTEFGVSYQLRNDTTNIGVSKMGNGGMLFFPSGTVDTTTTFNVLALKSGTCGVNQEIDSVIINIPFLDKYIGTYLSESLVCEGLTTTVGITQSLQGLSYQLMKQGNSVGAPVIGTGSDIFLATGNITDTVEYYIRATDTLSGCWTILADTQTVYLYPFNVDFTVNTLNSVLGDTIKITNLSLADSVYWSFGLGSSPAFDTAFIPVGPTYSTTGQKEIILYASGYPGCLDTASVIVEIFDSAGAASITGCDVISYVNSNNFRVLDQHIDQIGNTYLTGYRYISNWYNYSLVLVKLDEAGNVVWTKESSNTGSKRSTSGTGIAVDGLGNVYVSGGFGGSALQIDTFLVFNNGNNHSEMPYLMKFDSAGNVQWIVHGWAPNWSAAASDVVIDQNGDIIFSVLSARSKLLTYTFTNVSNLELGGWYEGDVTLIKVDADGNYLEHTSFGSKKTSGYFPLTYGQTSLSASSVVMSQLTAVSPKLKIDCLNRIVVYGAYSEGPYEIGSFTMTWKTDKWMGYIGIYDFSIGVWVSAFNTYEYETTAWVGGFYLDHPRAFDVDSAGNIYIGISIGHYYYDPSDASELLLGADSFELMKGSVTAKFGEAGNLIWYNKNQIAGINSLVVKDQNLYGYGHFDLFAGFGSQDQNTYGITSSNGRDMYISSHDLDGYFNWAHYFGGPNNDVSGYMHIDNCGTLHCQSIQVDTSAYVKINTFSLDGPCPNGPCVEPSQSCTISSKVLVFTGPLSANLICTNDTLLIEWASQNIAAVNIDYVVSGDTVNIVSNYSGNDYSWMFPDSLSGDTFVMLVSETSGGLMVNSLPLLASLTPTLALGSDVILCNGDNLILDAGAGWASYLWNVLGNDTTQTLEVMAQGNYLVNVTGLYGCAAWDIMTVTTANSTPPTLNISGNVLTSSAGSAYQWFLNGSPIPGTSGPTIVADSSGLYSVVVTSSLGCLDTVWLQFALPVGYRDINRPTRSVLTIIPNPAKEMTILSVQGDIHITEVFIYNIIGEKVVNYANIKSNSLTISTIDLKPGIYLVHVSTADRDFNQKLVVR